MDLCSLIGKPYQSHLVLVRLQYKANECMEGKGPESMKANIRRADLD